MKHLGSLVPPIYSTTERDSVVLPQYSVIWNTTNTRFEYWNGSVWGPLIDSSTFLLGSVNLHSDVDTTTTPPILYDDLKWDGANWVPGSSTSGSGSNNFVFAYDKAEQRVIAANVWQDIKFAANGQIDGWTHTAYAPEFTCGSSGQYAATVEVNVEKDTAGTPEFSIRSVIDGTEIVGSQSGMDVVNQNNSYLLSRTTLFNITSGQTYKVQMISNATSPHIVPSPGGAVAEVSQFSTVAAASITSSQYFIIGSPSHEYYVWLRKDGVGTDPAVVGKTGIVVNVITGDTANQVATKCRSALGTYVNPYTNGTTAEFATSGTASTVIVTNAWLGTASNIANVNTNFTSFTTTTSGTGNPITIALTMRKLT